MKLTINISAQSSSNIALFFLCLAIFVSAPGCATRVGDFSIVSTGTPQYAQMSSAPIEKAVKGTSRRFWFLCFPLGGKPTIKEAVDICLDKGSGDFMERVRIFSTDWTLLVLSYGSYTAQGDVGNSKFEQMQAK